MYDYECLIVRWIDGDTVELLCDLGFYATLKITARIYGINAPELHSKDPVVRAQAVAASDYAKLLAPEKSIVLVTSYKKTDLYEKYGRWLAKITLLNGKDFAAEMISSGHAVVYNG